MDNRGPLTTIISAVLLAHERERRELTEVLVIVVLRYLEAQRIVATS